MFVRLIILTRVTTLAGATRTLRYPCIGCSSIIMDTYSAAAVLSGKPSGHSSETNASSGSTGPTGFTGSTGTPAGKPDTPKDFVTPLRRKKKVARKQTMGNVDDEVEAHSSSRPSMYNQRKRGISSSAKRASRQFPKIPQVPKRASSRKRSKTTRLNYMEKGDSQDISSPLMFSPTPLRKEMSETFKQKKASPSEKASPPSNVCASCGRPGHRRRTSKLCPMNPKNKSHTQSSGEDEKKISNGEQEKEEVDELEEDEEEDVVVVDFQKGNIVVNVKPVQGKAPVAPVAPDAPVAPVVPVVPENQSSVNETEHQKSADAKENKSAGAMISLKSFREDHKRFRRRFEDTFANLFFLIGVEHCDTISIASCIANIASLMYVPVIRYPRGGLSVRAFTILDFIMQVQEQRSEFPPFSSEQKSNLFNSAMGKCLAELIYSGNVRITDMLRGIEKSVAGHVFDMKQVYYTWEQNSDVPYGEMQKRYETVCSPDNSDFISAIHSAAKTVSLPNIPVLDAALADANITRNLNWAIPVIQALKRKPLSPSMSDFLEACAKSLKIKQYQNCIKILHNTSSYR